MPVVIWRLHNEALKTSKSLGTAALFFCFNQLGKKSSSFDRILVIFLSWVLSFCMIEPPLLLWKSVAGDTHWLASNTLPFFFIQFLTLSGLLIVWKFWKVNKMDNKSKVHGAGENAEFEKSSYECYEKFNRKWQRFQNVFYLIFDWFRHSVCDETAGYFIAQGFNRMYASMAANASYSLTIDLDLPHVHIKRKSFIKSDKLDFTLGEWTYYNVPFGNFKNGFKSRMKLEDGKLVEEIVNLGILSNKSLLLVIRADTFEM